MDILSWLLISGILLAASAGMIVSHLRTWRQVQRDAEKLEEDELDYRRRQFRRRMQTSVMLGVIAVLLLAGRWVQSPPLPPWVFALYLAVLLLLVLWLALLAGADVISTKLYFGRLRNRYKLEEARLQGELRRAQRTRSNGRAAGRAKHASPERNREDDGKP